MGVHGDAHGDAQAPHAALKPVGRPSSGEPRERPAVCDYCDAGFTSKRYSSGWTRYCSKSCGQKAYQQRQHEAHDAEAAPGSWVDAAGYRCRNAQCAYCDTTFVSRKYGGGWTSYCPKQCSGKDAARRQHGGNAQPPAPVVAAEPVTEPVTEPTEVATAYGTVADATAAAASILAELDVTPADAPAEVAEPTADATPSKPETKPSDEPTVVVMPYSRLPVLRLANESAFGQVVSLPAFDPAWLMSFVRRLPSSATWTQRERERWLAAFTAILDYEMALSDAQASEPTAEGQA